MDHRRPVRPGAASRRPPGLFGNPSASRHKPLAPTHPKTIPIASEDADPEDDLVERDAAGSYKVMAPTTAMKLGVDKGVSPEEEEKEQEDQVIALYEKQNCHWDQAGILEEIKVALASSLERKVQSLENDRWMFEGEGKSKGL